MGFSKCERFRLEYALVQVSEWSKNKKEEAEKGGNSCILRRESIIP